MPKRLVIFAGFSEDKIIDDYVIFYLKELKKVADIVFVYDNKFSKNELKKVENLIIHQICKFHGEYDAGSYKRGYLWAKEQDILKDYESLTFCNDSVYGPFYPLKPIYEKFESNKNCDFWGMFEHFALNKDSIKKGIYGKKHIQSYFITFKKQVFQSNIFKKYMASIKKEERLNIIKKYEVGLSQLLIKNGFKSNALYKDGEPITQKKEIFKLIQKDFPFLKRHFISDNIELIGRIIPFLKSKNLDKIILNNLNLKCIKFRTPYILNFILGKSNSAFFIYLSIFNLETYLLTSNKKIILKLLAIKIFQKTLKNKKGK